MKDMDSGNFRAKVQALAAEIPPGKVMTYGQIAVLCGNPRAARIVGSIAHFGDPKIPWHRVVNKQGGLASGYPGGKSSQARHLREEGIIVSTDYQINIDTYLYQP